jgi:hypothetical protein
MDQACLGEPADGCVVEQPTQLTAAPSTGAAKIPYVGRYSGSGYELYKKNGKTNKSFMVPYNINMRIKEMQKAPGTYEIKSSYTFAASGKAFNRKYVAGTSDGTYKYIVTDIPGCSAPAPDPNAANKNLFCASSYNDDGTTDTHEMFHIHHDQRELLYSYIGNNVAIPSYFKLPKPGGYMSAVGKFKLSLVDFGQTTHPIH